MNMAANHKLTAIIAGREITGFVEHAGVLVITFSDGSVMKVKTASVVEQKLPTKPIIKKVRQQGTKLDFDLVDGSTYTIQTAEATSSVILRDKAGTMEYAD